MNPSVFNELCLEHLKLCRVNESETIAVLSRGDERPGYADSFMWAAQRLGAQAFHLRLPASADASGAWAVGDVGLGSNRLAVESLKSVDMVVDCALMLFSPEQFEIQASGTRVLTAIEPVPVLARLFPTLELRERVELSQQYLANAQSLRITNDFGTDITYRLGLYPAMAEYGYTDTAGRWDNWGCGFAFTGAHDDGVDGTIVLAPGDIIHPFDTYVQSPVKFTIEKGFIVDIRGLDGQSSLDADMIKAYIEAFDDPRGYGMSHVGWGLDERARWHGMRQDPSVIGVETRSFYGNVMFSTGPNNELGGPNDTACHMDIPMRGCSLYLDDELIVDKGELAVPALRPASRR
jgi:2,5-dihydroxypyridine 5,6-dioxygenase